MNLNFHGEGVERAAKIYAGPCSCGPAIHINLQNESGDVFATAVLRADECEEFIDQIRGSKLAVTRALAETR